MKKMMRKLITGMLFLTLSVGFVSAQTQFGIKGGYNASKLVAEKGGYTSKNLSSFNAGVVADIDLAPALTVRTGLEIAGKGGKYESNVGNLEIKPLYLEVPFTLNVNLPISQAVKVYAGAGPYVGVGIGGKIKTSGTPLDIFNDNVDIKWGSDNKSHLKRVESGLNVGAGLKFNKRVGLHVQYELGLTDNATDFSKTAFGKMTGRNLGVSGIVYF